jgi:hypothetical protein
MMNSVTFDTLTVRRYFSYFLFRSGGAQLEPAVARLFGCGNRHGAPPLSLYCRCTPFV